MNVWADLYYFWMIDWFSELLIEIIFTILIS